MEEGNVSENHLTSAAAFVEGGIQEACDDACSICLEAFCDSDPSTLTTCKHEFHLQCILEWCQRSSQCPMCWQVIGLKDPSSQELLDAVEHERNLRINPPRNTTIFHHPTLGDFELQHLPVSANESELEERIIQHLAAAAAMGRARQLARRESHRNRSSAQGRPHYLVFSAGATSPTAQGDSDAPSPTVTIAAPDSPIITVGEDSALAEQHTNATPGSNTGVYQHRTPLSNRRSPVQTSPSSQDRAGPSDLHSFSETLKSRLSALSTRYKESIAKGTRGWKERLFARNSSTPVPSTEAHREVDRVSTPPAQGIGSVSRMMDHLQIEQQQDVSRTRTRTSTPAVSSNNSEDTTASISSEMSMGGGSSSGPCPSNADGGQILAASSASN